MNNKTRVREMMDAGKTREEIAEALGITPHTAQNYQYAVRRPGETLSPKGRAYRPDVARITARMEFTAEQMRRMRDAAERYGRRPVAIMEMLLATIADDDLFAAVLDDSHAD